MLAATVLLDLLDKGLKMFIKAWDPYYQAILKKKTSADTASMGESVVTVLNKNANLNGSEKTVTVS